jgi:hypothetical protein
MHKTRRHPDLTYPWMFWLFLLAILIGYNIACHFWGNEIRSSIEESQRIVIRSVLYAFTIILFPVVKLIRHILLTLNQTMPGPSPAKNRYFWTVAISLGLSQSTSLFGFLMFVLGDDYNTLYIFSLLGMLGLYLNMPKFTEYLAVTNALSSRKNQ